MANYTDESALLSFLYETAPGRVALKAVTALWLSRLAGRYMDSRHSTRLIPGFVKKNSIDTSACRKQEFSSFNDFFTRQLKPELRPVDMAPEAFVSPCDGRLSAFPITKDSAFDVKGSSYTVCDLLGGDPVWHKYEGGTCLVFRLCVNDYHRYHYLDSGTKGENHFIPGVLHTVRPIALRNFPVFVQNSREYTVMHTDHFGTVTQVEVGAILIGRISNHHGSGPMKKGEEKGMFLYGGSSILVLLEKDKVSLLKDFPMDGEERQVQCGQTLGYQK